MCLVWAGGAIARVNSHPLEAFDVPETIRKLLVGVVWLDAMT